MKPVLSQPDVLAAELRVVEAANEFCSDLQRVRVALHTTMGSLPVLAATSAAAGLFGFWLARRIRGPSPIPARAVLRSSMTSALRLMLAFMIRNGLRRLFADPQR